MPVSNTTQQLLRQDPYYDDYYAYANSTAIITQGVDYDFHRILFRPRRGVQSRELTQTQTLLQTQLERLGSAQFRNGDRVYGGQLTIDVGATSGQVLSNTTLTALFDRDTNQGKYVYATATKSTKAHITQYLGIDDGETSNNYLIFKYQSNDTFTASSVIQDRDGTATATFASSGDVFNPASTISIDEGVCFVSGFFVRVRPQTIVLNAISNTPSYRVGLSISEEILDELDDVVGESLGDPANQSAPGAHRFRVRLTLAKRSLATDADANFIELARVVDGVISAPKAGVQYVTARELSQTLARRTFDESGDYTIRQFAPVIEGLSSANGTNSGALTEFVLSVAPGKAYVRGYEIETTDVTRVNIDKSRTTANVTNGTLAATVGNYTLATRYNATSPTSFIGNVATVDIHAVPAASINVTSNTTYAYSRVGTAKVRMVEPNTVPSDITGYSNSSAFISASDYKLFFFDVQFDTFAGTIVSASTTANKTKIEITYEVNGIPNVADALVGAKIALDGTSSGIYTIESYTPNGGSARAEIVLKEYLSSVPVAGTAYRLLFQIRDVDAFANFSASVNVDSPYVDKLSFQADVAPAAKDNGAPSGYTRIYNPNDNSLIYQVPEAFMTPDSLVPDGAEFYTWMTSATGTTTGAANTSSVALNFTTHSTYLSLPTGANISAEIAAENFIVFDITADTPGSGYIVPFSDTANSTSRCITSVTVTDTQITFTYNNGAAIASTRTFVAIGRASMTGFPPRTKTYYEGNTTSALASTSNALYSGQTEFYAPNTAVGYAYTLKTADVLRLRKVLYKSSNTAFDNSDMDTATDVTSYFILDSGQRDNTYEYARVIVQRGASSVISTTGRLLFVFDWFDNSGIGYAYIDSYLTTPNVNKGLTYEDIPAYTSPKFNRTISLRNVIDFRPVRSNQEYRSVALVLASSNTTSNATYRTNDISSNANSNYLIPVSNRTWQGTYQYYLSRIDRVVLHSTGAFEVKQGEPAVIPQPPTVDPSAMLLYEIAIPAYTLVDEVGKPTTTKLRTYDYKRYTMQDLAKVDNRVAHLEYYTAISQLERSASNQSILDNDNQERFKNGIVVDSFVSTSVADVARPEFSAAIDTTYQELHPTYRYAGDDTTGRYTVEFSKDVLNGTTTGMSFVGDMAIPSYTTEAFVVQPLATHSVSVNPFNIASYYGKMTLLPTVDTGRTVTPAQVIDMGGATQSWIDANLPAYTNWDEWQTTWTGTPSTTIRNGRIRPEGWTEDNHPFRSDGITTFEDTQTQANQSRSGTQFSYQSQQSTQSLGNLIVDTSIIHSIRKRDLIFSGSSLKPNTVIYPFFDGTDVRKYTQKANIIRVGAFVKGTSPFTYTTASDIIGQTVYVKKPLTGTVDAAQTTGYINLTGTSSFFTFELVVGQLIQIVKGTDKYLYRVQSVTSDTVARLDNVASAATTVTGGTLHSITPVSIANITKRNYTTAGVEYELYNLSVVRVQRNAAVDEIVPYTIQAGSVSPTKLVKDTGTSTNTATLIVDTLLQIKSGTGYDEFSIDAATIQSGVVRAYDAAAHTLRLDLDAPSAADSDIPVGTIVYFVAANGAGQSSTVTAYSAATQTLTLSGTQTLTNITAGQTVYSLGAMRTDGFLPAGLATSGGYNVSTLTAATPTAQAGSVSGALHVPDEVFPVGSRVFRLTDDVNNYTADATTKAESNYVASGLLAVEQPTSITTRNIVKTGTSVTDDKSITIKSTIQGDVEWVDPLAQSFLVDAREYPQGIFLSSVDLAFSATPPAETEVPVTVEIRPMVNGYPSSTDIVPCVSALGEAVATLLPAEVNTSTLPDFAQSTTYTRFSFPALVHLQSGQEYAIVVRSNSDEYRVYTAVMSQSVLGSTDAIVGAQPYAGSFFKSQNASTWTAEQSEDLMFRLNRATWTAGQTSTLVLRATPFSTNTTFDAVTLFPYDVNFANTTAITYQLQIMPMNATTEDQTGQIATSYTVFPATTYHLNQRSLMLGAQDFANRTAAASANTIDIIASFTTRSADVAPFIDLLKLNAIAVRHQINNMPLITNQFEIINAGAGYATTTRTGTVTSSSANATITGSGTSFQTTLTVGRDVVIGANLVVTVASIESDTTFTATGLVAESRSANTYATYDTAALTITASNTGDDAVGFAVVSGASTANASGIVTSVVLTSNGSGYLTSPTVSLSGTAAIQYHAEDWTSGGNALSRYIIKPVTLADGFEARDIKVYFDGYRPNGTNFHVYYKILPTSADTARLDDQSWRLMTQVTNDAIISVKPKQYREFEFSTTNAIAANAATDTTDQFKVFVVKIVLASNNPTVIPSIKNFRAIALDQ